MLVSQKNHLLFSLIFLICFLFNWFLLWYLFLLLLLFLGLKVEVYVIDFEIFFFSSQRCSMQLISLRAKLSMYPTNIDMLYFHSVQNTFCFQFWFIFGLLGPKNILLHYLNLFKFDMFYWPENGHLAKCSFVYLKRICILVVLDILIISTRQVGWYLRCASPLCVSTHFPFLYQLLRNESFILL